MWYVAGKWYEINDGDVYEADIGKVLVENDVYMLLFVRVPDRPGQTCPADASGAARVAPEACIEVRAAACQVLCLEGF